MNPDSTLPNSALVFRSWASEKACVMHVKTGVVGIANAYHEANVYVSPLNGQPVPAPVFVLGEHSFIADDHTAFMLLSPSLADVYISFSQQLGELMLMSMQHAGTKNVDPEHALTIYVSVLNEQISRLR